MAKQQLEPLPIPDNFNGTFNFFGFNFVTINFIEGALAGLLLGLGGYELIYNVLYIESRGTLILCVGLLIAIGLIFGLRGINGDPLHVFVIHFFRHFMRRRRAQYNPRVKYEVTYALKRKEEEKQTASVGVEYKSVFQQSLEKMGVNAPKQSTHQFRDDPNASSEFIFEDDIGVVEKSPEELKKQLAKKAKKENAKAKKKGGLFDGLVKKKNTKRKALKGN